jgi:phosphatidylglycerophosphate synthase
VAFAVGAPGWSAAGSGLFVVSMLLDRADGELARLTGRMSPGGHRYDLIADTTANAWAFVGIGVGLRGSGLGWWAVPMGLVAGASVAAVLWLVLRTEAARGPRAAELRAFHGFDLDDAMIVVPIAVGLDVAKPLLVASLVGAPVFAAWLAWRLRAGRGAVAGSSARPRVG